MTLNDPQIWTLIGVFAAVMIGGMTLFYRMMTITLTARFDGLENKFDAKFDRVDAKFDAVDAKFDAMQNTFNARFEAMDTKFDAMENTFNARFEAMDTKIGSVVTQLQHLDRDVQALSKRAF